MSIITIFMKGFFLCIANWKHHYGKYDKCNVARRPHACSTASHTKTILKRLKALDAINANVINVSFEPLQNHYCVGNNKCYNHSSPRTHGTITHTNMNPILRSPIRIHQYTFDFVFFFFFIFSLKQSVQSNACHTFLLYWFLYSHWIVTEFCRFHSICSCRFFNVFFCCTL